MKIDTDLDLNVIPTFFFIRGVSKVPFSLVDTEIDEIDRAPITTLSTVLAPRRLRARALEGVKRRRIGQEKTKGRNIGRFTIVMKSSGGGLSA